MRTDLTGIPATMLIPLWARAVESENKPPIIEDPAAEAIIAGIDYDFSTFESAKKSQTGVSIRTMLLDKGVSAFLDRNPNALVINLGAGLDTRYARLQPQDTEWRELDVPESIALREKFFSETPSYRFIARSMFDFSWMDEIQDQGRPVLFIAEGVFMYFSEEALKPLFIKIADRFPGAEMLFEMLCPFMVGRSNLHDSVNKTGGKTEFKWGLKDTRSMTKWLPQMELIEEWNFFDYCKKRWGLFGVIARLPLIRPHMAHRIVHICFAHRNIGATH